MRPMSGSYVAIYLIKYLRSKLTFYFKRFL